MIVAELRLALDAMEQNWSAQDSELLGDFGLQKIVVDAFNGDGSYGGFSTPIPAYFDARFGVMLMAPRQKGVTDVPG
jgi:hypothetical protein